jgi:DNA-binding transcriptional ArsR family regulator
LIAYWREMDTVFKALADESRRQLLDQLHRHTGQTLGELCAHLDMTRQAVTKHLRRASAFPYPSPPAFRAFHLISRETPT